MTKEAYVEIVREALEDVGLRYRMPTDVVFELAIHGRHTTFGAEIRIHDDIVFVLAHLPLTIPAERRSEVAELVARTNLGRLVGRFDLNFARGEVLWVGSIPLCDAALSVQQMQALIVAALQDVDEHSRSFARLLFDDNLTAAEAFAEGAMATTDS